MTPHPPAWSEKRGRGSLFIGRSGNIRSPQDSLGINAAKTEDEKRSASPFPAVPDWHYNWQGPVTYVQGAAQNNTNPYADFLDHVLVRIGNILYDPSYGVTYGENLVNPNPSDDDLLQAFQTDALGGYFWNPPAQGNLGAQVLYFRPATMPGVTDVKLKFNDYPF